MSYQEIIGYVLLLALLLYIVLRNPTEQEQDEITNRYR